MAVYCETTLNYADGEGARPVPVAIRNGRDHLAALPFEDSGFTLLDHASAVSDWRDFHQVLDVHCAEAAELARWFTDCDQAVAYEPLIRSPEAARSIEDYAPIEFVHSDYTDDFAAMVRDPERAYGGFLLPLLTQHGLSHASLAQARRLAVLQLWRNVGHPQPDRPLALCDARTATRRDVRPVLVPEYGGARLEFETFYGVVPPDPAIQHWYTFPGLGADEVIAFRTYDSRRAAAGQPFWTLHSAFRDPCAGDHAPPRESVEMRVLCIWD